MRQEFRRNQACKPRWAWKTSLLMKLTGLFLITGLLQLSANDLSRNTGLNPGMENVPSMQQVMVSGTVTDENGNPMPGVSIVVRGTTRGTIADQEGKYALEVEDRSAVLVFSFVGYNTKEVTVGDQLVINMGMEPDVLGLEEVVVIGYGAVKRSDLTGAVSSVSAEDINVAPIQSLDQGLAGRSSGVMVTQTSGAPGAVASIRIRGTNSLQGGNEPLYVIDGFPIYSGGGFGNTGGKERLSGLALINPNDIESIEILKDASATAIYGARAANGVVLITTKSGREGQDQISFDAYYGMQQVTKKIDVMNAYEYAQLVNEAYTNDGLAQFYDDTKMAELAANPKGTDWQDEVFRTAPTQSYQLTFSGGDSQTRYAISGNYLDQEGIIINSNFKRYNGRINLDRKLSDNLTVGTHTTITRIMNNAIPTSTGGTGSVVTGALEFNPALPVYSNPELGEYTQVNTPGILTPNPVGTAREMVRETINTAILGDVYGEWEFIRGLTARVSFGANLSNTKNDTYIPSIIYQSGGVAEATVSSGLTTNWLNENTLTYNTQIGDLHSLNILAGATFQGNRYESVSGSSQDFVNNVLQENSLESGAIYNAPGSDATEWGLISYLGRVNYNLMEKYLVSVNGRVDGSSRFGENNKYAFFPSFAVAWRAIEEPFIQDLGVFSNLKIRTSYGFTGNQEIGLFNSLPTLATTTYAIGGDLVTGFMPNIIPNPDLRWEKTAQFNVGLDLGFLNNRLRITTDYYHKKTTDLIYSIAIPYVSGFGSTIQNIGSIQNQGVELSISSTNISGGDFRWTTNFNISLNRNKVLELGGEEYKDIGNGDGHLKTDAVHRLILNEPIGIFYGYVSDGLFRSEEELAAGPTGQINWVGGRRFKDLGGPDGVPDGIIDATYDRQIIGDPNPDFFGGMNNTFEYRGIELNVFMQWSVGNDLFNYMNWELNQPSGGQNVYKALEDRWSPSNPDAEYPVATTNRSVLFSDFFIEDGSYLKIKTISLGYNFPVLKLNHLKNLKVYVTAQNFITFTNYSGFDPEVSYRGTSNLEIGEDYATYPQSKTILFGVRMDIN